MDKTLITRIVSTHDTELNWKAHPTFIPMPGEMIVYDPDEDHPYARVKIGDGQSYLAALPFYVQESAKAEIYSILGEEDEEGYVSLEGGNIGISR